jgi:AcrR family transcriptional regulator
MTTARREEASTARRSEILDAALHVFAERGYRGTSIDAVAERAGLTRQGVLHYYPSKKRLLVAVLGYREELSRAHLATDHPDEDWPSQVAEVIVHEHASPWLAQVQSVMMAESMTGDRAARQYFHEHYRTLQGKTAARLAERYGERLPSGLTPRAAATAVLAILDGMQQQWLLDGERSDYPEIMRDVLAVLLGPTAV